MWGYISNYLQHLSEIVLSFASLKIVVAALLAIASFFFGDLYIDAIIATVMLMVIDLGTGLTASYVEKIPITSRRMSGSVLKGTVYLTAISAAHFVDQSVPGSFVQSAMISFVALTEFTSILENIGRMGFSTPKKILNQLKDKYGQ
jgi:phage-related holin